MKIKTMSRQLFFLIVMTGSAFLWLQCSKEEEEQEIPPDLVYYSLEAERDTIAPGGSTTVKASATGTKLEYYWSASLGDIVGEGAEVTYTASPCQVGENEITCRITNGNQSETKTVEIVVL